MTRTAEFTRFFLNDSWRQIPCCRAFNQMNVGIMFTLGDEIQFINHQMSVYLKRKITSVCGRRLPTVFKSNPKLVLDFELTQTALNESKCCCFLTQKSLFPHQENHRLFKIMAFWVNIKNKSNGICWVFQDTTNLIEKDELTHYEETSMRLFELLRQSDEQDTDKQSIFYRLLEEIVEQYQLKIGLYFTCRSEELVNVFAVGNQPDFPYRFEHVPFDETIKESVAYQAMRQRKPVGSADITSNPFYQKYLKSEKDLDIKVATYSFPVIINKAVEGVISLYSYDPFFFSESVVRQLTRLINEICLYLRADRIRQKNARELQRMQKQLEHQILVLEKNKRVMQKQIAESNKMVADLILARNQAEEANRSKMNFLANVSHELRTPLNAILGFTQMIQTETFGPIAQKEYREYILFILKSATHLLSLINDILDLSRLESGKLTLMETTLSLKNVLKESLDLISQYPNASERNFTFDMKEDIDLYADERVLKQIALNILSNSVKFTETGGHIGITVQRDATGVTIIFSDDGVGIPADKIPQLFQPFTQIENVLTRAHQGSGLGLVLVKKMVILHQGSVRLESEEGKGTRLIIHFPANRIINNRDGG